MKCPKCESEFTPVITRGYATKFCSRKCANSRTYTPERKKTHGVAMRNRIINESPEDRANRIASSANTQLLNRQLKIEQGEFDKLSIALKRDRILFEQGSKCLHCGNDNIWNDKFISFELDHINGDRTNNSRTNLRLLCPNCHSQTETFVGKNTRKVTDADIIDAIPKYKNISEVCNAVGLMCSGGSYTRVRQLMKFAALVNQV